VPLRLCGEYSAVQVQGCRKGRLRIGIYSVGMIDAFRDECHAKAHVGIALVQEGSRPYFSFVETGVFKSHEVVIHEPVADCLEPRVVVKTSGGGIRDGILCLPPLKLSVSFVSTVLHIFDRIAIHVEKSEPIWLFLGDFVRPMIGVTQIPSIFAHALIRIPHLTTPRKLALGSPRMGVLPLGLRRQTIPFLIPLHVNQRDVRQFQSFSLLDDEMIYVAVFVGAIPQSTLIRLGLFLVRVEHHRLPLHLGKGVAPDHHVVVADVGHGFIGCVVIEVSLEIHASHVPIAVKDIALVESPEIDLLPLAVGHLGGTEFKGSDFDFLHFIFFKSGFHLSRCHIRPLDIERFRLATRSLVILCDAPFGDIRPQPCQIGLRSLARIS